MKDNNLQRATLAGGCFWCTEAVFDSIKGVETVISGYTGGTIKNPAYREICTGRTGHAEAIQVYFNPKIVSFIELLELFFATHNPTTLNQQGNDKGTQYRSAIFYESEEQKHQAEAFISFLDSEKIFQSEIVTEITPLGAFYNAEDDHQEYYKNNKEQSYCQFVINPKIDKLKTYFSDKLKDE